jgi:membrane fusion protein, multidrug efflux system
MVNGKRRRWRIYLGGVIVVVVAIFGVLHVRHSEDSGLASAREARATELAGGPRVEVATAKPGPHERTIRLLGDARPYLTTTLYGKVSGYLKSLAVDRGDPVKEGQVVAEIESAETDSQYLSAQADLANKQKLAQRNRELLAHGNASIQVAEQSDTDLRMADANVRQLGTLKSYETIRAPFDGTVTARFADPGALIQNATTNQSSSLPVLTISDNSRLRVGVYVEQSDVGDIHVGEVADVVDATNPDHKVTAKVTRTTGELDPKTRTLYTEIDVDNKTGMLVAGSFVYVTLHVPIKSYPEVPLASLVTRGDKSFVARVEDNGEIHFRPVSLGATDGRLVAITDGLVAGERVAINLPSSVTDGSRIQPIQIASKSP